MVPVYRCIYAGNPIMVTSVVTSKLVSVSYVGTGLMISVINSAKLNYKLTMSGIVQWTMSSVS